MARYRPHDYKELIMVPVSLQGQPVPGTLEYGKRPINPSLLIPADQLLVEVLRKKRDEFILILRTRTESTRFSFLPSVQLPEPHRSLPAYFLG